MSREDGSNMAEIAAEKAVNVRVDLGKQFEQQRFSDLLNAKAHEHQMEAVMRDEKRRERVS